MKHPTSTENQQVCSHACYQVSQGSVLLDPEKATTESALYQLHEATCQNFTKTYKYISHVAPEYLCELVSIRKTRVIQSNTDFHDNQLMMNTDKSCHHGVENKSDNTIIID